MTAKTVDTLAQQLFLTLEGNETERRYRLLRVVRQKGWGVRITGECWDVVDRDGKVLAQG